jgi:hypothetical protein
VKQIRHIGTLKIAQPGGSFESKQAIHFGDVEAGLQPQVMPPSQSF